MGRVQLIGLPLANAHYDFSPRKLLTELLAICTLLSGLFYAARPTSLNVEMVMTAYTSSGSEANDNSYDAGEGSVVEQ